MKGFEDISELLQQEVIAPILDGEDIESFHFLQALWRGKEIPGAKFSDCIFENILFKDIHFNECSFFSATFINCRWENCYFENCHFNFSKLSHCTIQSSELHTVTLLKTSIENLLIASSYLDCVDFIDSPTASLKVVESEVERSGLMPLRAEEKEAYVSAPFMEHEASTYQLMTKDSRFKHFILLNFDFSIWENQNSILNNLIALNSRALNYDFSGVNLTMSQFTGSDMRGANFSSANVSQCSFIESDLSGANFDGAKANYALLHKANLPGASFNNTDLMSANLSQSVISGSSFVEANLTTAYLSKSDLRDCSFRGVEMAYTDISYANISGSDFDGARFYYSNHHAVVDVQTRYGSKSGIMETDQEMLKADLWLMS